MNQFKLLLLIIFASFVSFQTTLCTEAETTSTPSKKRRRVSNRESKKPIKQPVQSAPQRKEIPGISNQPPAAAKHTETSNVITVDKELQIIIPSKSSAIDEHTFVFEPYTQDYITKIIKIFHVVLPEVESSLLKLNYRKDTFKSNMRFLINVRHFLLLMLEHKIFQLRDDSLQPLINLNHHLISNLVIDVQRRPDQGVQEIQNFLKELPFEDIFSLRSLYEGVLDHIQKDSLNSGLNAYIWIENQLALSSQDDSLHTYRYFLDKRPLKILDQFLKSAQIIFYENLQELLPISSETYLEYSERLLNELKLLNTDKAVIRRLELHLEFSRLQFEPYEEESKIYENLMGVYPQIPGSKNYFENDQQLASIVFPFFDQLINYADRRYERGKHACQDPLANEKESCLQHWREATHIYRYVAQYSPHTVTTSKAINRLQEMQNKQVIDYPFISRAELLELQDSSSKPHL